MPLLLVYADYCRVVSGKEDFFLVKTENVHFCWCITCAISCMTAWCCLFISKLNQLLIVFHL